jgi:hypothetical protein
MCGKEIGKGKQYCEECRIIRRKESSNRCRQKPREKRKEYMNEYYHRRFVRLCNRCGKEIGKGKQYCDECREIRKKEVVHKHMQKPEVKEKKRKRDKEYWARPEVKARLRLNK